VQEEVRGKKLSSGAMARPARFSFRCAGGQAGALSLKAIAMQPHARPLQRKSILMGRGCEVETNAGNLDLGEKKKAAAVPVPVPRNMKSRKGKFSERKLGLGRLEWKEKSAQIFHFFR